jgi:hypothetical protein
MVSFMIFTASVQNILDTPSYDFMVSKHVVVWLFYKVVFYGYGLSFIPLLQKISFLRILEAADKINRHSF